jgi:hypothetical protein
LVFVVIVSNRINLDFEFWGFNFKIYKIIWSFVVLDQFCIKYL